MNIKEPDVLYVVIGEDRGMGVSVQGVFSNRADAEALAAESSRFFIDVSHENKIEIVQ